jgi:hypothetical protein
VERPQRNVTATELKLKTAEAVLDKQFKIDAFVTEFKTAAPAAVPANVKAGLAALRFTSWSITVFLSRRRIRMLWSDCDDKNPQSPQTSSCHAFGCLPCASSKNHRAQARGAVLSLTAPLKGKLMSMKSDDVKAMVSDCAEGRGPLKVLSAGCRLLLKGLFATSDLAKSAGVSGISFPDVGYPCIAGTRLGHLFFLSKS